MAVRPIKVECGRWAEPRMFYRCARLGFGLAYGAVGDQAPLAVTCLDHVVKRRSLVKTRTRRPRGWGCRWRLWNLHKHGACYSRAQTRCVLWPCTNTVQRDPFAQIRCIMVVGGYLQPQGRYFIGLHDETRRILCAGFDLLCVRQDPRVCVRTNTVQWPPVEQRYRGTRRRNTLLNWPPAQARCRVSHSRKMLLH